MRWCLRRFRCLGWLILCLVAPLVLGHCAVRLAADYDAWTFEEIIRTAKQVDLFYGQLLEKSEEERTYASSAPQYVAIESELRALLLRNQARPLNLESSRILEIILTDWQECRERHKARGRYPTGEAKLDRQRFMRLFGSAAAAERVKKAAAASG